MPNTMSAKKALRQSQRKRAHNQFWKQRVRSVVHDLKGLLQNESTEVGVLKEKEILLQKYSDKATKEKVISRNKANRLKSRYAQKISAHQGYISGSTK
ncbi:30S ribosomal protein S20 [Patescibacteria group bacterium]|nr:30S ribosomal protein S20 [Patescibacteria group bacterium]